MSDEYEGPQQQPGATAIEFRLGKDAQNETTNSCLCDCGIHRRQRDSERGSGRWRIGFRYRV
jgi:hypothetical protein